MSSATITIEGFTSRDAELKWTPSGQPVLEISVPVTPQKKNDQGGYDDVGETAWYRCALWGRQAEAMAADVVKGALVQIVGTLKPRTYEKDGQQRTSLDVTVRSIGILRAPRDTASSSGGYQRPTTQQVSQQRDDPWGAAGDDQPPF